MAAVDPFWLRDRVGPGLDNDPDELIRAAGMAEKLDGRRSPARTVDDPGESGAIKSIRAYQRPRGLKPDGLMNPNGPTVQRMTAELYERGGPRRRIPARGGTVPLWGPVGAGGDNDPRDLAATRHALFLAGLPVRGTDAETPLRRFQQMHGLTVDGRMEPFGPTHDMLDRITAPKLAALAGDDPDRPQTYTPREPELVGRVLRDRPSTIRTFFQEPETLPSEAQQAAAVSLGAMNAEDAAIQAQWGALAGSEGDDLLAGGAGEDGLAASPAELVFDLGKPGEPLEDKERRVVSTARLAYRNFGDRTSAARMNAAVEDYVAAQLDEARDRGIEVDEQRLRDAAEALAANWNRGLVDPDALGRGVLLALEFAPITGEIMSAREALRLYRKLGEEEENGASAAELRGLRSELLLAVGASLPFLGKFLKAGKALDKLSDVSGLTKLKEQQGYRKMLSDAEKRMTDHDIKGFNVTEHLSKETWEKLDKETRGKIVGLVNIQKGKAGERLVKEWLDLAGFTRPLGDEGFLRRYRIERSGKKDLVRHYDEVTDEVMESLFGGLWFRKVKGEKGTAWEVKTDRAELSKLQTEFAAEARKRDRKVNGQVSDNAKKKLGKDLELPDVNGSVRTLRVPLTEVDPVKFRSGVRQILTNGGVDQSVIDELTVGIDAFFAAAHNAPAGSVIRQSLTTDVVFMAIAGSIAKQGAVDAVTGNQ